MAELALALYVAYLVLAFGARTLLQIHRTGRSGFVGLRGTAGFVERLGGMLFVVALLTGLAAPVVDLFGGLDVVPALRSPVGHIVGVSLTGAGIVATLWAQVAMGSSWRIGVDPAERTTLVTDGPFSVVRNPIFAAMLPTSFGLVLLVPNAVAVAGFVGLVVALELQTRSVEEPYLLRTHGSRYAEYAARVGRFVPRVGRLSGS